MLESRLHSMIEQLVDIEYPSEVHLSLDGRYASFVLGTSHKPDKDTPAQKAIHIVEIATRKTRRFTGSHTANNDLPRWSPDSQQLAFVSNRANADEMQLYAMPIHGGEARQLTDLRGDVDAPMWSPDGDWIAFLYNGTLDKRHDPDPIVVDENTPFNRIWLVNTETRELNPVTPESCHVFEYAWSLDGKKLVILTSTHPNPAEGWYSAQPHVIDLHTGDMRQLFHVTHQMGRLAWSPDGKSIAFVSGVMSDEGNVSGEVYVVSTSGGEPRCLTADVEHSITWIEWRDGGILYGARHVDSTVLGWIDPQTGQCRLISRGMYAVNGHGPQQVSVANDGTFAAVRDSFTEPPNIFLGSLDNDNWQPLTGLPIDLAVLPQLRVENKHWYHPDGTSVHGFLVYPPDYTPGKRYPLFLNVHGGPSWGYVPNYMSVWARLMTSLGCIVLMPNPRGSWGYGHAYQSANVGDLGGGDWQDINAGVDALIDEGLVDPERLAIGGWSYGGYLVAWAITQTERFRCAIAGASITSYESNYGVVSNREWQTTMFGSNVYDDYELHRSRSPMAHVSRVKTPTLLVHGEKDPLAPAQQAIEFYTALKHFGVPTQLVIYPREPHGFQERAHQIDLLQRMVGWVQTYLFE
ncbi:MAG: S9 family peptidase [Burkholderiales bacterium]|nr:S9 family peptidase [Anaerolineae bacterium]